MKRLLECVRNFYVGYLSRTYWFASPEILIKVVARVLVRCSYLFMSIGFIYLSTMPFNFINQDFLCWFFTFFYSDCIIIHLSRYLSLGVVETFLWDTSKPDIRICFAHRTEEGRGKGDGCVISLVVINLFTAI